MDFHFGKCITFPNSQKLEFCEVLIFRAKRPKLLKLSKQCLFRYLYYFFLVEFFWKLRFVDVQMTLCKRPKIWRDEFKPNSFTCCYG